MFDNSVIDTVLDTSRSLFFQPIEFNELKKGDHIFCVSKPGFFSHHGIYIGNDRVIHFMPTKGPKAGGASLKACEKCGYMRKEHRGVVKTCLDCFHTKGFLSGTKLYLYRYGLPKLECKLRGNYCTHKLSYPADQVVAKAEEIFESKNQFGKYNFILHNCEDFASYCKCGTAISTQADQRVGLRKHILRPMLRELPPISAIKES